MPRLAKKAEEKVITNYVTLIGDIFLDEEWNVPEHLRVTDQVFTPDTGVIYLQLGELQLPLSRAGLNIGIDADLVEPIKDALYNSGMRAEFQIISTGSKPGLSPTNYKKADYLKIQSKVASSPYLKHLYPELVKPYK